MALSAELRQISKAYSGVHANNGVNLVVRAGTVHALVGENGAGKSTAMKTLFGLVTQDSGEIFFNGKPVKDWNAEKALKHGVGMVHQHFMLAGPETVQDNLVLGVETTRFGLRDRKAERRALEDLMQKTGLHVPLDERVENLAISLQSRCEILKVLYRNTEFLILDEPTAVLTPQEVTDFLETLRTLRKQGHTILIVTHKLKEVMAVADDVTVLRAGKTVANRKITDTTVDELSELMVGRRLQLPRVTHREHIPEREHRLDLQPGEITGIAGVEGSGQADLIRGLITLHCEDRNSLFAIIPADRHKDGLVLNFNLYENLRLGRAQAAASAYAHFGSPTSAELKLLEDYDVRPRDARLEARALSGGNQQKLIVARELGSLFAANKMANSIVVAVHPTRGVDLGAIEFIHRKLLEAAAQGASVLLVSSELDELMALSHRIGVFYSGVIAQWFEGPPYDEQAIGRAMMTGQA